MVSSFSYAVNASLRLFHTLSYYNIAPKNEKIWLYLKHSKIV